MATVVLTEKPSVARDIARVLGANKRAQGYAEGNGYIVTWALGHLVQFAEPDDYGPPWKGRWSFAQLPMIPEQWKLKTTRSTSDQYQIVKKLLNSPQTERVICATDAGREGEHIFRLIYEHARCKKPFSRLWVSSLTDEAIQSGFRALQEGVAFDHLAAAARARGQADWLMGMNLTRAYTVHNKALCTIGRVQTPTLSMVVKRDAAIASFVKAYFYELVAQLEEGFAAKYCKDGQTRIDKKEEAERLHRQLSPNKVGTVRKVEKKIKRNRPPASLRPQQPPARRQPLLWLYCGANPRTRPSSVRNPQAHNVPAHREPPHLRRHGAQVARHIGKASAPAGRGWRWHACAADTGSAGRMSIAPN